MYAGENADLEHAPHAPVALFDANGRLQGWSPAFADDCAHSSIDFRHRMVGDLWPEFDPVRWQEIWQRTQGIGSATVVQVLARSKLADHTEIVELEIGRFISDGRPLVKVEVRRTVARRLHLMQQEILEDMANGAPLKGIMETLCRRVEALIPSVTCSVMAITPEQQLLHIASPSLPLHYQHAVDGILIGPNVGSCGTAAFRGEAVEVTDIDTDPLWADYKHLALPLGLRACWSSPIKSSDGRVIGAFGFYYPRPRGPTTLERQIVAKCLHLCMIGLEQEETRARAYEQAFTDQLTHIANRARFQKRVSETTALVAETGQRFAVYYIGLDRFRSVNEMVGYAGGDELLRAVAGRLKDAVKDHDTVARIGGDEFALIQVGDLRDEDVADRARELIDLIGEPFIASDHRLQPSASIGIALGPYSGGNAEQLIQDAALAMRRAKEIGRGRYVFHEKHLNERMQERRRAEQHLRDALAQEQLEVHYQPVFDLQCFSIQGAEALVRWRHPERGMISPAEFVPLAEEYGLIDRLGEWVIRNACLAAAHWPSPLVVAVNLSPVQFANPGLVRMVAKALADSGLAPERLELEITESVLLHDSAVNIAVLDQLSDLGVSVALDDFGTGYSSLSYLQRFSFDRIKIDHSFIGNIVRNEGSLKIVRAIVMLAHSLGLQVTAEGVETDEQLAAVRGEGCDAVQGYYTGVPMPLATFLERLEGAGHKETAA